MRRLASQLAFRLKEPLFTDTTCRPISNAARYFLKEKSLEQKKLRADKVQARQDAGLIKARTESLQVQLKAQLRGKGRINLRECRKSQQVPSTLFSLPNNEYKLISLDKSDIETLISKFGTSYLLTHLLHIQVDGLNGDDLMPVIVKNIHMTSSNLFLENLALMYCPPERYVNVHVPVRVVNEDISPGAKKGGLVTVMRPFIKCQCRSDCIPSYFEIDASGLDMKQSINLFSLAALPDNVRLLEKFLSEPVCRMRKKK